jgi:hypothetical protein
MRIRKYHLDPAGSRTRIAAAVAATAALLALAGCATFNTYNAESHALSQPITVDGTTDDWPGEMYVVPGERMSVGFQNDGQFLYIAVLIEESFQRYQIMSQGLTVWFDPKGGKEKAFGIRYPLGFPPGKRPAAKTGAEGEGLTLPDLPEGALSELEIVRSEKEPARRLRVAEAKGLEIKVVPGTGLLVYEMKIPLRADAAHPLAVGASPGAVIGIGFETPKFDASSLPRSGPIGDTGGVNRPPSGGMGGRGGMGGMGGAGGAGGRSGRMGPAEPLKVWAIVQLSPGKSGAPSDVRSIAKIVD